MTPELLWFLFLLILLCLPRDDTRSITIDLPLSVLALLFVLVWGGLGTLAVGSGNPWFVLVCVPFVVAGLVLLPLAIMVDCEDAARKRRRAKPLPPDVPPFNPADPWASYPISPDRLPGYRLSGAPAPPAPRPQSLAHALTSAALVVGVATVAVALGAILCLALIPFS